MKLLQRTNKLKFVKDPELGLSVSTLSVATASFIAEIKNQNALPTMITRTLGDDLEFTFPSFHFTNALPCLTV